VRLWVVVYMGRKVRSQTAIVNGRRSGLAWLLFVVATAFYFVTRQAAIVADGIYFDDMLQTGRLINHHLLYLPLVWGVQTAGTLVADVSPELAMKLVSALAGGVGVAVAFLVACRTLQSRGRALVAALTLMGLLSYWFHSTATELHSLHAACASVLLLGLLRALDGEGSLGRWTWMLCAFGTALVPLSHMSGYAAGLPILYAICRVRSSARWSLLSAILVGVAAFGGIYGTLYFRSDALEDAVQFAMQVSTTGFGWQTAQDMLAQSTLYALPVATLVPAGLRVLFRTAPEHGWFCLLWVIAWPLASLRHLDDLYGSYHTPTYLVSVVLAVVAMHAVAKGVLRAIFALTLASAPAWFLWTGDRSLGLIAWAAAAAVLFGLAGTHVRRPSWMPLLALATFGLAAPVMWPLQRSDVIRDQIREVTQLAAAEDLILAVPAAGYERFHWTRFFCRADGKERAICPADLDWLTEYKPELVPQGRQPMLDAYRAVVLERLGKNQPIWFVGEISGASGSPELLRFFDFLRQQCRFREAAAAPLSIYQLHAK
jgi:hypothetical protein